MTRIRGVVIFASVFAILSAFALVGAKDVKAQESSSLSEIVKRIEALESKGGGGNVSAPKIRGLKIGGMIKHRFEYRDDSNGDGDAEDIDFTLQRIWLDFDADVSRNIRGFVRLQDSRTWGAEQSTTGNLGRVDVMEAWVDIRNLDDWSPWLKNISLKFGRWQQFYGNHRLIGHLNWANQGRGYDGIKLRWDDKKGNWLDAFAYQISEDTTGGVSGETGALASATYRANRTRDELFWGVYSHFNVPGVEGMAAEPYFIIRNRSRDAADSVGTVATVPVTTDGGGADLGTYTAGATPYAAGEQRYTAGARITGKKISWLPGVDFTFEQAWQFGKIEPAGNRTSKDIRAFAGAWGGGYTFTNVPWTPRIGYDFVYASGDSRAGSQTSGLRNNTFSQLYPTGHARLGYIDFHGWQNIKDHQVHLSLKPTKKLMLKADWHMFSAAEKRDGWYTVGGGFRAAVADANGSFDSDYGDELDLTLKYQMFKHLGVTVGYSHYFIDDAIENRYTNDKDTDWFYIQSVMKF
ncbi:MAG: alginate export family protein [Candidatus Brocadiaceae bacterium]|nr:alginate export family protein [Candidatus Brocadiaceae bacterium]